MMNRSTLPFAALLLGALALAGCSPEAKAQSTLQKYETVFNICKEETAKAGMKPGEHRCSLVSSMAVDMSLKDSGLDDAKIKLALGEWLDKTGYKPFYIPPDKRAPEHR
jgi:hypothetical protein